jgi:hypothetical protein
VRVLHVKPELSDSTSIVLTISRHLSLSPVQIFTSMLVVSDSISAARTRCSHLERTSISVGCMFLFRSLENPRIAPLQHRSLSGACPSFSSSMISGMTSISNSITSEIVTAYSESTALISPARSIGFHVRDLRCGFVLTCDFLSRSVGYKSNDWTRRSVTIMHLSSVHRFAPLACTRERGMWWWWWCPHKCPLISVFNGLTD